MSPLLRTATSLSLGLLALVVVLFTGLAPTTRAEPLPPPDPLSALAVITANAAATTTVDIDITAHGFSLPTLAITPGTAIRWTNQTAQSVEIQGTATLDSQSVFLPLVIKGGVGSAAEPGGDEPGDAPAPGSSDQITAQAGGWQSGSIPPGQRFSRAFSQPGRYPYTLTHASTITGVIIVRPVFQPIFLFSLTPLSRTVTAGQPANYSYTLVGANGFTNAVSLRLAGLPPGVSDSFSANPVTPPGGGQLTLTTAPSTPAGLYPLTVIAEEPGGLQQAAIVLLDVQALPPPDFSIGVSPSTQSVTRDQSVTYTVAVTAINGLTQPVTLAAGGLPYSATVAWGSNPLNPSGQTTLSVTPSPSGPTGTFTLIITGSGTAVHTTTATLLVSAQPPVVQPDFSIGISPSTQTITRGLTVSYTVAITAINGLTQPVTLAAGGLPVGATAAWGSNPLTPSGQTTLSVTPSPSGPTGTFTLVITGSAGTVHTASAVLMVTDQPPAPQPDFSLAVQPGTQTVVQGQNVTYTISLTPLNGFSGPVDLALSGAPGGVTASFSPNPATPGSSAHLSVTTTLTAATGTYPLAVTGRSGSISQTVVAMLTIAAAPPPDFVLAASPNSGALVQGQALTYSVILTGLNRFTSPVTLDVGSLPAGMTANWSTNPLTPGGSALLNVTAAMTTPTDSYGLVITGTGGGLARSTPVSLTVLPHPDFAVAADSANQTVTQGQLISYTISLSAMHGFAGAVTLAVTGLPTQTNAVWTTNPVSPPGQTVLSLTTTISTPVGSYPMTISATDGSLTRTTQISLTVQRLQPDVVVESLQVSPALLLEGQTAGISVTVRNQSVASVPAFTVDWYSNRSTPPAVGDRGVISWTVSGLSPNASLILTGSHSFTQSGSFDTWAQVDPLDSVSESDETNNVTGPVTVTVLSGMVDVCGAISQDTVWQSGRVYVVTCNVTVNSGVTLTIEPDVIVKVWADRWLEVHGNLVAEGTEEHAIVITSLKDDSLGGDTNEDGTATTPASGDWRGIFVSGTLSLSHTVVQYGGNSGDRCHSGPKGATITNVRNNQCGTYSYDAKLFISNSIIANSGNMGVQVRAYRSDEITGSLTIDNSVITGNSYEGIYVQSNVALTLTNSSVTNSGGDGVEISVSKAVKITNNLIKDNDGYGIRTSQLASPVITGNSFISNTDYAVAVSLRGQLHLEDNNGVGNGYDAIWLNATIVETSTLPYNSTLPYILGTSTIAENVTLTIEPDVIIKVWDNGWLEVHGKLIAEGIEEHPIVITSLKDDSLGGDTNEDGTTTSPAPGDWRGILVDGTLHLSHTVVQYGGNSGDDCTEPYGGMITSISYIGCPGHLDDDIEIIISHSIIANSGNMGIQVREYAVSDEITGSITIDNSVITGNSYEGVYVRSNVALSLTNSSVTDNGKDGIRISAFESESVKIANNSISNNSGYGIRTSSQLASPIITGNSFISNSEYAMVVSIHGQLHLENNNGVGNGYNAIQLFATIVETSTLPYNSTLPYILGTSAIAENVTLTIEPDVIVKVWADSWLEVHGNLIAEGIEEHPIVITSLKDDSLGGDTNEDGTTTSPAPGDWRGIFVGGTLHLSHTVVQYGGNSGSSCDTGPYGGMITNIRYTGCLWHLSDAEITISHSIIANSGNVGVQAGSYYLDDSTSGILLIDNSQIKDNKNDGVRVESSIALTIDNSTIKNNGDNGIFVRGHMPATVRLTSIFDNSGLGIANTFGYHVVDAHNNWWGDDSGPAPYGSGDGINYRQVYNSSCDCYHTEYLVDADPWLGKDYWAAKNNGSSIPYQAYEADPVNTATGNYAYQRTDLSIETRSLPLAFSRAYNSANPQPGLLGDGWTHSYNIFATENVTDATVIISYGDGRQNKFVLSSTVYLPPAGVFSTLTKPGSSFVLTHKDQTVYNFDSAGRLASIVDKNGNSTTLTFGSGGRLSSVTGPAGRSLSFTYDGQGRLSQVGGPLGRTVSYGYDASGDLTTVTDVMGMVTTFAYTGGHRLTTITDANGHSFINNVYNGEGKVIEQRDALGNLTSFSYDTLNRQTTVTDPRGHSTLYSYDAQLRLISQKDALNQTVSYSYDADNNRTSVTDKRGNTTNYSYDTRGNVTGVTDALGNSSAMSYDTSAGRNNLTSQQDALGRITTYSYDASSNLIRITDPAGNVSQFSYNSNGQLTAATDGRGNVTSYSYDSNGYQSGATDALGHASSASYDAGGRMLSETDALGRTTSYTYDAANRLLSSSQPLGKATTTAYDNVGNRTSVTDPKGGVTTFSYDAKDRLVSTTDPLGNVTTYSYDAVDNQTGVTDALGHTTTSSYDALNRRSSVTDALGNTTTTQYDANGNRTRLTDANGQVTQYSYDALNRLVSVTDAAAGTVSYSYDAVGNRTGMTDANGHTTGYSYTSLDQLSSETDPLGNVTGYGYDANGNRTSKTKADGTVISYSYDALDQLTGTSSVGLSISYSYDAVGNRSQMSDATGATSYSYDALGRLTQVSAPTGTLSYGYDLNDNRLTTTYPGGGSVTHSYDAANQLISVTDWQSGTTSYSYDAAGRQTGIQYANGSQANYTYDSADRLLALRHTSPVSGTMAVFTYTLDAVGNRLAMQDLDGTTSYSYDALYRLSSVTYPGSETVSYSYDPMGNRLSMNSTVKGTTVYTYNAADRLLAYSGPGGTVAQSWDANGNLLSKGSASYSFDALDRLTQVISGTTTVQFSYNGDGVRVGKTVNGATTSYVQDVAAPLPIVLVETSAGQSSQYVYGNDLLAQFDPAGSPSYYHPDGLGSTRALSNQAGQRTDAYSYDVFGQLRTHTGSSGQPFTFAGEQMDAAIGLQFLRARYYDPEVGRFVSRDPFDGFATNSQSLNPYVYTQNAPVDYIDRSGEIGVLAVVGAAAVGYGLYKMTTGLIDLATTKTDAYIQAKRNHLDVGSYTEENYEQRERDLQNATGDLLKGAVDVATSTPGTTLTGKPGLPSSWLEFAVDQVGGWFKDALLPVKEIYNAHIDYTLGTQKSSERAPTQNYYEPISGSTNFYGTIGKRNQPGRLEWSSPPSSGK